MDPDYAEALKLLMEATRTQPDAIELHSDSDRIVLVEREPEPGVEVALVDPEDPSWLVLSISACEARPSRYPEGIPFVAANAATVVVVGEDVTVSWRGAEGIACGLPSTVDRRLVTRMMEVMGPAIKMTKEAETVEPSEIAERSRAFMDSLDPAARSQFLSSMQPAANVVAKLQRAFGLACNDTDASGWKELERRERSEPLVTAMARYEQGRLERSIALVPFGGSGNVVLRQRISAAA